MPVDAFLPPVGLASGFGQRASWPPIISPSPLWLQSVVLADVFEFQPVTMSFNRRRCATTTAKWVASPSRSLSMPILRPAVAMVTDVTCSRRWRGVRRGQGVPTKPCCVGIHGLTLAAVSENWTARPLCAPTCRAATKPARIARSVRPGRRVRGRIDGGQLAETRSDLFRPSHPGMVATWADWGAPGSAKARWEAIWAYHQGITRRKP